MDDLYVMDAENVPSGIELRTPDAMYEYLSKHYGYFVANNYWRVTTNIPDMSTAQDDLNWRREEQNRLQIERNEQRRRQRNDAPKSSKRVSRVGKPRKSQRPIVNC